MLIQSIRLGNETALTFLIKESAAPPYSLLGLELPLIIYGEDCAYWHSFNDD